MKKIILAFIFVPFFLISANLISGENSLRNTVIKLKLKERSKVQYFNIENRDIKAEKLTGSKF
ncbi:MAG TPA: hypothetical protein DCX92_03330, partial [Bacteroidetes bacterium]|nr:hypothetical protein [Bacteroidota bacterium]